MIRRRGAVTAIIVGALIAAGLVLAGCGGGGGLPLVPIGAQAIALLQPNGGESWQADAVQDVEWQSTGGIDHVRLRYSPNAGTTWREIIASTPNTGSYGWTVPRVVTAKALVKATAEDAANAPIGEDTSDAVFTILAPAAGRYLYVRSDAEGVTNGSVTVAISVTDAAGIAGADITLTFNPIVLTATGAETTTLTGGFIVIANPGAGQVRISLAGASGIASGSGALVNVRFTVSRIAAPGTTTALTLQSASLWDESAQLIAHDRIDGLLTVR